MVERVKKMKAYISYEYNDETRELLLDKSAANTVDIVIDGRKYTPTRVPPKAMIDALIKYQNAKITPAKVYAYTGREKVLNVVDTKSRTEYVGGGKYIRIRVLADSLMELMEKISEIKQKMKGYGAQERVCIWNRGGKIHSKIGKVDKEIVPTVKSEFDKKTLQAQKMLELQTSRDQSFTPEEREVTDRYKEFKDASDSIKDNLSN